MTTRKTDKQKTAAALMVTVKIQHFPSCPPDSSNTLPLLMEKFVTK